MTNGTSTGQGDVRTYRGRSLEELIPRIKEELGSDAVILRQREGLAGGIGGFFQRGFVEVEARAGAAGPQSEQQRRFTREPPSRFSVVDDEPAGPPPYAEVEAERDTGLSPEPGTEAVEGGEEAEAQLGFGDEEDFAADEPPAARESRAAPPLDPHTAEGLSSPAIRAVLGQAEPFASPGSGGGAAAQEPPAAGAPAFSHELEVAEARERVRESAERMRAPAREEAGAPAASPATALRPAAQTRPPAADTLERSLVDAGIAPALATAVVGEAVSHLMPFGSPRGLKRLVRTALARRIPVQGGVGAGGRAVAFVGAGGAGKTLCAARLAAAYAAGSDLPVLCLTLDGEGRDALARLLEPAGVEVLAPADPAEARAWMSTAGRDAQVVVDTPSVSPRDDAAVRELASRVRGLGSAEVHLALPATTSAAAARDLIAGLAPLGARFLALTHADETAHLGSPIQVTIENERPISYVSRGSETPGGLEPADPAALATLVLP